MDKMESGVFKINLTVTPELRKKRREREKRWDRPFKDPAIAALWQRLDEEMGIRS